MSPDRPVNEYAKSAVQVAVLYMADGVFVSKRDFEYGQQLLEKVAVSNSEEAPKAAELLKKIKAKLYAQGVVG